MTEEKKDQKPDSFSRRMKRVKRAMRRPFEWLGIWLAIAVLSRLSHRALFGVADFMAAVGYMFDRGGRKRAHENLKIIFGHELPKNREEKIVRGSYRNMARTLAHVFWTCRKAAERAAATGELSSGASAILEKYRPLITVSGHIGCWEILSQLVQLKGIPIMSVAKPIGSDGMTELLMKSRRSIGQRIIPADGAFMPLLKTLKEGNDIGLLTDQAVRPSNGGLWVRYFGVPVPVSAAPAFLSAKTHAAVIVAWSRPLKDGRYRCEVVKLFEWRKGLDIWGLTQDITKALETVIRRHPSIWALNYNCFRKHPKPDELKQLEERERKRSASREANA